MLSTTELIRIERIEERLSKLETARNTHFDLIVNLGKQMKGLLQVFEQMMKTIKDA